MPGNAHRIGGLAKKWQQTSQNVRGDVSNRLKQIGTPQPPINPQMESNDSVGVCFEGTFWWSNLKDTPKALTPRWMQNPNEYEKPDREAGPRGLEASQHFESD